WTLFPSTSLCRSAADRATDAAAAAGRSASAAAASAARAAASADYAYEQADRAAAAAVAAGKDAAQAAAAAYEAVLTAVVKLIEEATKDDGTEIGTGEQDYPGDGEDLTGEGGLSAADKAALVLDVTGIFDPSPVSDGASGLLSLFRGDIEAAGLSAAALIPYAGDALAKPAKFAKYLEKFDNLAKHATDLDWVGKAAHSLKHLSPNQWHDALTKMNKLSGDAAKAYKNKRYVQAAEKFGLPTNGPVPFVPRKDWDVKRPQIRGGGFEDKYGNVWTRAKDGKDEWDVQIPKGKGFETFAGSKNQGKDYSHANISKDGKVTH
ncbi:polymorphic toxin type 17 domain-containing protein, partial [Streptomyces sp. NPDC030392]|uniref:polymorphic toxin type 17 domain-containing protein n=1 Tax=Streptomyces sp. NPDC030392 TaxID=3155468 RepID=UPI003405D948